MVSTFIDFGGDVSLFSAALRFPIEWASWATRMRMWSATP